jgi:uncharacterized membrane protein HdeD (DUF308 family)
MSLGRPPVAVLVIACLYILVGAAGFVGHFHDLSAPETKWILLTEVLAVVAGIFMLLRHNWARWLAVAWMAFHVAISYPVIRQIAIHSLILAAIAWLLFRPTARAWFRSG